MVVKGRQKPKSGVARVCPWQRNNKYIESHTHPHTHTPTHELKQMLKDCLYPWIIVRQGTIKIIIIINIHCGIPLESWLVSVGIGIGI